MPGSRARVAGRAALLVVPILLLGCRQMPIGFSQTSWQECADSLPNACGTPGGQGGLAAPTPVQRDVRAILQGMAQARSELADEYPQDQPGHPAPSTARGTPQTP